MEPVDRHQLDADASFDGGDLDCGNGLLLLIRQHIDPMERGQLLEFRSTEISVEEDFPAWCRMTGNELVSFVRRGKERSFLVCKGKLAERQSTRRVSAAALAPVTRQPVAVTIPTALPAPSAAPTVRTLSDKPVKIALPGPYLLTRLMWLECLSDRVYRSREHLADDVVRVLREELHFLLAAGVSLVQVDEPVLAEVVYTGAKNTRSFMCGALSEKGDADRELQLARDLINRVVAGLPRARLALHVCRGNWTRNEEAALAGDYRPLVSLLSSLDVGTLFLELCTPRAGELDVLADLPRDIRVGVGVVNQKHERIEPIEEIADRARRAVKLFGPDRGLLTPDCGFATFADNPVASAQVAEAKLRAIVEAAELVRRG